LLYLGTMTSNVDAADVQASAESRNGNEGEGSESSVAPLKHSRFTKEELDSMLYEWDEGTYPIQEYHVKDSGQQPPKAAAAKDNASDAASSKNSTGSSSSDGEEDEVKVYLDFSTDEEAYVVMFYQPWCPHCQDYKPFFIEIAQAVTRRTVGTKVNFYAVSCELYEHMCHTYEISGYPTILGYAVGSDPYSRGIELNGGEDSMSPDLIGDLLSIELANEALDAWESSYSNSEDRRNRQKEKKEEGTKAAELKKEWQSFPSTVNDRYHNAGLSLAFALKSGVYDRFGKLRDDRALVLSDFLDLVDWTTPQAWTVRTGLVKELRLRFHDVVVAGKSRLADMVEHNQEMHEEIKGDGALDHLWGHIDVPRRQKRRNMVTGLGGDVPDGKKNDVVKLRNRQWTESCTHSKPAMGFTCGLWDLFHIITIGASMQDHQLYGFHSGYLTSHRDVALIIRNFVANFFACDVCRWNFIDMYDACGHDHCNRLPGESSIILGTSSSAGRGSELSKELSLWLFEVHNAVNARLMTERAERRNRDVTIDEVKASVFPTEEMCPNCWTDIEANKYDRHAVYTFLKEWYWPKKESMDPGFMSVLNRNLVARGIKVASSKPTASSFLLTLSITVSIFVLIIKFANSRSGRSRQQLQYSQSRTARKARKRRLTHPSV